MTEGLTCRFGTVSAKTTRQVNPPSVVRETSHLQSGLLSLSVRRIDAHPNRLSAKRMLKAQGPYASHPGNAARAVSHALPRSLITSR